MIVKTKDAYKNEIEVFIDNDGYVVIRRCGVDDSTVCIEQTDLRDILKQNHDKNYHYLITKLEAEIKALREALELCRPLVGFSKQQKPESGVEEFEERHNKLLNTIDQLLTKNEG